MIKELVGTMRLHRALGDVEGLFQKMVGEIVPLSGWLHEKDPKAHRIVNYINEIIIAEWHFKNKDTDKSKKLESEGVPSQIQAMELVLSKGEQFSLRLYDLMAELDI